MENEKLNWYLEYAHDGGNPRFDLDNAAKHNYKFAYEDQWDYNPSLKRKGFLDSCENYPYPSLEPGCSNSSPQAPEDCYNQSFGWTCYYYTASLSGKRSPYMSNGAFSIWILSFPMFR